MSNSFRQKQKDKFLNHLASESSDGNISLACKLTGISRQTVYEWKKADGRFESGLLVAIEHGKENLADLAEDALKERIKAGDTTAIIFALKSLRPDRYNQTTTSAATGDDISKRPEQTDKQLLIGTKLVTTYADRFAEKSNALTAKEKAIFRSLTAKIVEAATAKYES